MQVRCLLVSNMVSGDMGEQRDKVMIPLLWDLKSYWTHDTNTENVIREQWNLIGREGSVGQ